METSARKRPGAQMCARPFRVLGIFMSCGLAVSARHQSSAVFTALAVEEETCRHQERAAQGSAQHSQPVGAGLGQGLCALHRRGFDAGRGHGGVRRCVRSIGHLRTARQHSAILLFFLIGIPPKVILLLYPVLGCAFPALQKQPQRKKHIFDCIIIRGGGAQAAKCRK